MAGRLSTTALVASYLAAFLAFMSAAVTAYWLVGGTALLDTVGVSYGTGLERRAARQAALPLDLRVQCQLTCAQHDWLRSASPRDEIGG